MSDHWDFYFCRVNDAPASVFVDLGIRREVPDRARPQLLWISLEMISPRADGLSSSEEFDALVDVEKTLEKVFQEAIGARYVGRITASGRRDFYFYAESDRGFEEAASAALAATPDYAFTLEGRVDEEWKHYVEFLHPSVEERRSMSNRGVVESLRKHGDPLTKRRRIDHWIFFPGGSNVDAFFGELEPLGFEIADQSVAPIDGDANRSQLQVFREDLPDQDSIDEVTLLLLRLAKKHGGVYDGWETSVEKEELNVPATDSSGSGDARAFWSWFAQHEAAYRVSGPRNEERLDELLRQLHEFHRELYFCVGGPPEGPFELIIKAEGRSRNFPAVRELIAAAPPLDGWRFIAFSPAHGFEFVTNYEGVVVDPRKCWFLPLRNAKEPDAFAMRVGCPGFDEKLHRTYLSAVLQALDSAIGEVAVTEQIDAVDAGPLPADPASEGYLELPQLPAFLEGRRKKRNR